MTGDGYLPDFPHGDQSCKYWLYPLPLPSPKANADKTLLVVLAPHSATNKTKCLLARPTGYGDGI
jgi:hypothetical protein